MPDAIDRHQLTPRALRAIADDLEAEEGASVAVEQLAKIAALRGLDFEIGAAAAELLAAGVSRNEIAEAFYRASASIERHGPLAEGLLGFVLGHTAAGDYEPVLRDFARCLAEGVDAERAERAALAVLDHLHELYPVQIVEVASA